MILEKLNKKHFFQPIFEILDQLSFTKDTITFSEFENWIDTLPSNQHIFILENDFREIIGMGTIVVESKIIHSFGKVGHIEDIIISEKYRGKGFGRFLVKNLVNIAKEEFNVYKVILNCSEMNLPFYKKCGLDIHGIQMGTYF